MISPSQNKQKDKDQLFTQSNSERTRGNGFKLEEGRFCSDTEEDKNLSACFTRICPAAMTWAAGMLTCQEPCTEKSGGISLGGLDCSSWRCIPCHCGIALMPAGCYQQQFSLVQQLQTEVAEPHPSVSFESHKTLAQGKEQAFKPVCEADGHTNLF